MAGYSIAGESFNDDELRDIYQNVKSNINVNLNDLDIIFEIGLAHKDRFPAINLDENCTLEKYIERWVNGYIKAMHELPSERSAKPRSSCTDPSISVIVKTICDLSDDKVNEGVEYHNLFMSAENIQGELLEEYIASKVRPYGFIWCRGNIMAAIDFCNSNGTFSFQVKNRKNTENSSSKKIREGSSIFIERWYRLDTKSENGQKSPIYKWDLLNRVINDHKTEGMELPLCCMTEEIYQKFLHSKAIENRTLIIKL